MENNIDNQKVKNAMCYIPFVAIVLYFIESKKTPELQRHINYGMIFFWAYFVLNILVSMFFMGLLFFFYIWLSIVFWYKAYIWEDVRVKFIDDFLEKHKK